MRPGVAAICGVILICTFMGIYGWLSLHHIDTQQFLYVFGSVVSVNVGVLMNVVKTAKIEQKVDTVVKNTNGALNKLIDKVEPVEGSAVDVAAHNGQTDSANDKQNGVK